jgi:gentisate 1,2-dioxygenase
VSAAPDTAGRPDAALIAALEAAGYHPLWTRYKQITPVEPKAKDAPRLWRWADMEPFTVRAAQEVPIEDVERRAIIMVHPSFDGATQSTSNLLAAFTVLNPGDKAPPHRHVAAAIRFATRAEGAVTIVNGRRCEMHEGDLILTPPLCWHGHINEGNHRTVWFDAANIPLINQLDANTFEPGSREATDFWKVDEGDDHIWGEPGLVPSPAPPAAGHSPKYRYSGSAVRRMLKQLRSGPDGARTIRYVNPMTGGPLMPALDCYAKRLCKGVTTKPVRTTWNAVCLVVSGEGRATIGESNFAFEQHDVFSIPHWSWASFEARRGNADLFIATDRSVYERLDLAREEMR